MNPIYRDERTCPSCGNEISEWNFMGSTLDNSLVDNDSGAMTFEVETNCLLCGKKIIGLLWLVEINDESKIEKVEKGL